MGIFKKFEDVVKRSMKDEGDCFSLMITKDKLEFAGIGEEKPYGLSAILIAKIREDVLVKGWLDREYYETSSMNEIDTSKTLTIAVDCRKRSNTKILYRLDSTAAEFTAHSDLVPTDSICIFWETENLACLTVCSLDPIRDEVIREVVSGSNEPLKRFLRSVVRQNLNNLIKVELHLSTSDQDSEEITDEEATHGKWMGLYE